MSLLSKKAILGMLDRGELEITPRPADGDFDTDAVDVHLGEKVYFWKKGAGGSTTSIRLSRFNYRELAKTNLEVVQPDADGLITLRPQTFYLADISVYTRLPPNIAMHVQGKSSLARLGIGVHVTAPHAHAGWSGRLALEIFNYGAYNVEVCQGDKFAQLSFWRVEDPVAVQDVPTQQFSNQAGADGSS
jgi:dCTP deaminase